MDFKKLSETKHNAHPAKQEQVDLMIYLLNEVKEVQSILSSASIPSFLAGGLSVGLNSNYPRFSDDYDLLIPCKKIDYFTKAFCKKYEMNLFNYDLQFLSVELPRSLKGKPLHAYIIGCTDELISMTAPKIIDGVSSISLENICAAKTRELVRASRGREIAKDAFDIVMLEYYSPKLVKEYFTQVNALNDLSAAKGVIQLLKHVYFQMKRIITEGLFVPFPTEMEWKANASRIESLYNIEGVQSLDNELKFLFSLTTNSTRKALQKATKLEEFNIVKLLDKYLPTLGEKKKLELKEALILDPEAITVNPMI